MQHLKDRSPGLMIAGLRGGSGKTVISLGIAAAWKEKALTVAPFKKGPDYIDAGWLALAAGRTCYNLDSFLCTKDQVSSSFTTHSNLSDIALIEGNRGLYDSIDKDGSASTAEIAKLLDLPVLLVLDCTKSTRTMAALVMGCVQFDPDLRIMGVILNRVAGKRHEGKVRDNIKEFCRLSVFGAVPKLGAGDFPERHMGLVPSVEHALSMESIQAAGRMARKYIDLDGIYDACLADADAALKHSPEQHVSGQKPDPPPSPVSIKTDTRNPMDGSGPSLLSMENEKPMIGVIRDSAFQFYYPDNLEALEAQGARLRFISPLKDAAVPEVDAVYMGGGFPETHAAQLAENVSFAADLRRLADEGLPIYAECGGLIFLGRDIRLDGEVYPMAGVLPVSFGFCRRPVGHGYTQVRVVRENPFYPVGMVIRGHEFRYSSILSIDYTPDDMAFSMERGQGITEKMDGFFKNRVFGTYTHVLSQGTPQWAKSLVSQARAARSRKIGSISI
ncbi:MAG: cobyrinic acid a,c-diamide synthase [Desulfobacteraceae bacterium 4572_89]|nr:MAG: cobyrinic acid a,c-diamide synthase [Desulfobacteraceae bacterium 4572_89]